MRSVYPRVCGGTGKSELASTWQPGLSPRVRGNLVGFDLQSVMKRSIPACAGEPSKLVFLPRQRRSIPACAGNQAQIPGGRPPWRSIPACAGEPRPQYARMVGRRVYPRVCGGTWDCQQSSHSCGGLSPRVRGNPPATGSSLRSTAARVYPRVCGGTSRRTMTAKPVARSIPAGAVGN